MSAVRDDLAIPAVLPSWQEHVRRNSLLSSATLERLSIIESRQTTSFVGLYDQVADLTSGGAPLDAASNYTAGDFYTLSVNGAFTTSIPELNGQIGGPGDQIISDGTVWLLLATSTDFLSSTVDDTAAGVITFSQVPNSPASPTNVNDLTRRGYVDQQDSNHATQTAAANDIHGTKTYADAGDAVVQGNLDAHIADAPIHFPDAPADGEFYGRTDNAWVVPPPRPTALMYGDVDSFTLNTAPKVLQNYDFSGNVGGGAPSVDAVNGTITINSEHVYTIQASAIGTQGNNTKEEAMRFYLRIANSGGSDGDYILDVFDIATDKTDQRSVQGVRTASFPVGTVLSLVLDATAGLGTFNFDSASFQVTRTL